MLLHKSNINMAIAIILLYGKSLYDLQKPRYDFFMLVIAQKRRGKKIIVHMPGSDKDFWVFIGTNTFHLVKKSFHSNRSINFLALAIFDWIITLTYCIEFIEKVFSFDNSKSKAVELF